MAHKPLYKHAQKTSGKGAHRADKTSWRMKLAAVVATTALLFAGGGLPAMALPSDRAEAEGLMLSGGSLDSIASLAGPYNAFPPGGTVSAPLNVGALGLIDLVLGVQLFGGNNILTLGATGQYASTTVNGSIAASGLITGGGAIQAGSGAVGENTSLNLTPVLSSVPAASALVSTLSLELGALASRAESTRVSDTSVVTGSDYQIANGQLVLTSPALTSLTSSLNTTLGTADDAINLLAGPGGLVGGAVTPLLGQISSLLGGLLGGLVTLQSPVVTTTLSVNLQSALTLLQARNFVSGPVTINLGTGTISIDLDQAYALNDAAPNTSLLTDGALNANITAAIGDILTNQVPAALTQDITTVLNTTNATANIRAGVRLAVVNVGQLNVTISGSVGSFLGLAGSTTPTVSLAGTSIVGLPIGTLLTPITTLLLGTFVPAIGGVFNTALNLAGLQATVNTLTSTAVTALAPLLSVVNQVVNIVLNVQQSPGNFRNPNGTDASSFTQRAVSLRLVGGAITLDLASSTVRAVPLAAPDNLSITPDRGPVQGGTPVLIEGDNLTDVSAVTFGDEAATFTINGDGNIETTTPPQDAAGPVTVSITNPDGTNTDLEFTYFDVTTVDSIVPNSGSTLGGTAVTITGSCFTGTTGVSFDGVPVASFVVDDDNTISVVTAAGAAGTVDVVITNPSECGDLTVPDGFTYVTPGAPTITGIAPDRGPESGGTVVVITGTEFLGATAVTFGGTAATSFTVNSDTQITATTPEHAPGTFGVVVTNGTGGSAPFSFEFYNLLDVTSVAPTSGPQAGGTEVTLTGDCLTGATAVTFDGDDAEYDVISDTEILAITPPGTGTVDVTVTGAGECGSGTLADAYEYLAPPVITEIDPAEGPETGGTVVTITGTNLTDATGVTFDGDAGVDFEVVSDTEITVTTPPHAPGTVTVEVQHPGGDTDAGDFEYFNVPSVTALDPEVGPESGGTVVTITGEGFTGSTGVTFDGILGTDFDVVSDTEITVTTPPHAPAVVDVVVQNPNGNSPEVDFEYVEGTAVDDVDPGSGPAAGGNEVTITGVCFTDAVDVLFGTESAEEFTVVSDTVITAVPPAGVGVVDVTVVGSAICGTGTLPDAYEYLPAPVIDSVTPTEGPETGGTLVTITGEGFTDSTGVNFDGTPGTSFTVVSDTEITVVSPPHAPGSVTITVLDPGGNTPADDEFEYLNVPSITTVSPAVGPTTGGTVVTLTGEGFTGATGVTFDGDPGTSFTVDSDTQITVTTPAHVIGIVPVVVLHPVENSAPGGFQYVDGTAIDTIVPAFGPEDGGNEVTITGYCFTGAITVLFDGVPVPGFTIVSNTEITATVPPGLGLVDVTVLGSIVCGNDTLTNGYQYLAPPVIDDVDPTEGLETGGTIVTITGSGFTNATGVTFGGDAGTSFTVVNDFQILVTTPPHAPGIVPIVVQHPGGDAAAGDFEYLNVASVTDIDPDQGPDVGGTVVTVTGEGLTGSTDVTFDGIAGTDLVVNSDTELEVTTPPHAAGLVDVVVEHPNGDTDPVDFTYLVGTSIDTIDPGSGPAAGGTEVTITGFCFSGAADVLFDGVSATEFEVLSNTQIVATSPAGVGIVDVAVVGAPLCGTGVLEDGFEFLPAPIIDDLDPVEGPETGGTVVTITGSGFSDSTGVDFGGDAGVDFDVVSDTEITVTTPPHAPGSVTVTVLDPGGDTEAGDFEFLNVPSVTTLAPDEGPESGSTVVTITGEGFTGSTGVTFDGVPGTDFDVVSDTEITVTTPPHAPDVVDVIVVNPNGNSDPVDFEYLVGTSIDSVVPGSGPAAGGNEVVITGFCFTGATDVTFGGVSALDFTVDTSAQITATVPPGVGIVDVVVIGSATCGTGTLEDGYEYIAPPVITDLDPVEGPETGGTVVTITGTNLTDATGVTFDGDAGVDFDVLSDTQIVVTTPPHAPDTVEVLVLHPGGDTDAGDFEFLDLPSITELSPTAGPEQGGTIVTITGEGFTGATGVTFGGDAGTDFDVVSDTEITVTTPPHAVGTVDVIVLHPNGDSEPVDFEYTEGTSIDSITPTSGPAAGGNEVTIAGFCFTGATDVLFDGVSATGFSVFSNTVIIATVPAGTGIVDVTVVGSAACGSDTLDNSYEYLAPPIITDLDPVEGPETGGTEVTITGSNLADATGVIFGGYAGVDFEVISGTEIVVTTPPHAPGSVTVTVLHPGGNTDAGDFEFLDLPSITELEPPAGPESGGTVVTITGEGFTGATGVTFGGDAGTDFDVVSDTEITVTTPPHAVGTVDVIVLHPNGNSEPVDFEYVDGTAVDEVDPTSGPEAGGTEVTITGVCFTDAEDVLFGTVSATSFTVVSDSEITAEAPAGTGIVDITVIGSALCGTGTLPDAYEYLAPPVITDLDPVEGPETGGTVVTITGTNLTDATGVTFDGDAGTDFDVLSDTEIVVTTPPHAVGTVTVEVQHPGGDTEAGDFEYLPVPSIADIDPDQGPEDGGTGVTLTGEDFTDATGVTFDGLTGLDFTVVSDTEITVTTPPHAPEVVDVVVLSPVEDSEPVDFEFIAGTEIDGVDPDSGPAAGGNSVTITGVCFTGATDVLFDGVSATDFTVDSDTQITAEVPAGVGVVDVTVVGSSVCGTETLPDGYEYLAPPVITDLDPVEGPETGGTEVTITGTNLTDATGVTFGGDAGVDFDVVSDTEIVVTTPEHDPEVVEVLVLHPGGDTDAGDFEFLPLATITDIDPGVGPESGGTVVTITGVGFTDSTGVTFDGLAGTAFSVVDDTEITVTTPPHAPEVVDVIVLNPLGDSEPYDFEFVAGTEIDGVDPDGGPEAGGNEVTITGECFTGATDVLFGATSATSFTVVSDTEITAEVPAGVGVVDVTVVGSAECGTETLPGGYEYFAPPVVTDLDPVEGPETGGTEVTITGTGFTGTTGVTFDGDDATEFEVVSDTEITAVSPAHAPGVVEVEVQHPGGDVVAGDFEYLDIPEITDLEPDQGTEDGGTVVTVTGEDFTGATGVTFDGELGTDFTVDSDTQITVTTPAHDPEVVDTVVEHPNGDSEPLDYEFIEGTQIDEILPPGGPEEGGNEVVITGSCFTGATDVLFGITPATSFTVDSDTQITAIAPAGVGIVDVTVIGSNSCGTETVPDGYEYTDAPVVSDMVPAQGPEDGGTEVTFTGINFDEATGATFDGIEGLDFTVDSDTQITVVTPAHVPAIVDAVIESPDGNSDPEDFEYIEGTEIDEVTPPGGPEEGGNEVVITGSCFTGATEVLFGDVPAEFTVDSDTQITAIAPEGVGTVDITVVGSAECGTETLPDGYEYTSAPVIGAIVPGRGPTSGGTEVTVTGSNFDDVVSVTFDGLEGVQIDVVDDTELTVVTPPHAVGFVDVIVTTEEPVDAASASASAGSLASAALAVPLAAPAAVPAAATATAVSNVGVFEYYETGSITGVTPNTGPRSGGTEVTLSGTCFTGATGVLFGTNPARSFEVINDSTIVAVTPAGSGTVDVTVLGSEECGDSVLTAGFTYDADLAYTGQNLLALAAAALLLLLGGGVLLVARTSRRRQF